jgi:hypothetical protein
MSSLHMQRTSSVTALLCVAIIAFFVPACSRPDERMYPIGPGVTADLVVYFKTEATHDQIEGFWQNVISYPDPNGRGYYHRPGVGTVGRVESVESHEGISINFFSNATDAERAQLRRGIDASPIVFTVLENIAPKDVKTLKR